MTSTPASRSARATTFAPRSWPSRPGFAMTTRMLLMDPPTRCCVPPTFRAAAISLASGQGGRGGQRCRQGGQVPVKLAAIGVVARIDLGQYQRSARWVRDQDAEARGRVSQPDAGAIVREVTERQVAGVNHVHVEVHDERIPAAERGECPPSRSFRVGYQLGTLGEADALTGQERATGLGLLAWVAAQHGQPRAVEHWDGTAQIR